MLFFFKDCFCSLSFPGRRSMEEKQIALSRNHRPHHGREKTHPKSKLNLFQRRRRGGQQQHVNSPDHTNDARKQGISHQACHDQLMSGNSFVVSEHPSGKGKKAHDWSQNQGCQPFLVGLSRLKHPQSINEPKTRRKSFLARESFEEHSRSAWPC